MTLQFVAPKSYEEAKKYYGQSVETPYGVKECVSMGYSGDVFNLAFGDRVGEHDTLWKSDGGWMTLEEQKASIWDKQFAKLPKVSQRLVNEVLGSELEKLDKVNRKAPDRLVGIAKRRLIKSGKIEAKTCGRCGGSGHFSYNQINGTTCFGCGGTGKKLPGSTEALKAAKK